MKMKKKIFLKLGSLELGMFKIKSVEYFLKVTSAANVFFAIK